MLWVVLQAADELCDWMALEADLVDGVEQREPAEGREAFMRKPTSPRASAGQRAAQLTCQPGFCV